MIAAAALGVLIVATNGAALGLAPQMAGIVWNRSGRPAVCPSCDLRSGPRQVIEPARTP